MHLICLVSLKKEDVNEWVAMDVDDGLPWADGCGRWAEGLEWVGLALLACERTDIEVEV